MRKLILLGLYEIALFGGTGVTDLVYGWAPLWFWATITTAAAVGMPALYAPEIWRWLHRQGTKPLTGVAKDIEDPDVAQFETLLPLIERLAKARKPTSIGGANMSFARWRMAEDGIELTAHLGALSIPYPAADASNVDWYRYLIRLDRLSRAGKLEEARKGK